ncbi:hypothetical protein [Acidithiobacillus caldus]|uniref:hypothetical protein n=1 Tax=Acidithiobacillus caldus TaxID=33059 RepID=UPI000AE1726E|nr:hypothetical protein [Acidithiobacillus caldus]
MFRKVSVLVVVALLAGCSSHHRDAPNIQPPKASQVQPSKQLTSKQAAVNEWKALDSGGPLKTNTPSLASYTP